MFLHRALRQQGSESLASIRPAPSARSAAVAESEGFEPPEDLHPQRFSRPPQSTTLPTLHIVLVSSLLSLRSTRSETRQIFFLASPRMLMDRSPFAALHSLGDSSKNHFFFARAGLTGVDFTSSTIFAVTSGFALR